MEDDPTPSDATPAQTEQPSTHDAAPADPPLEPIQDFHTTLAFRSDDPPPRSNSRIRFKSPKR
jgi:hypothetical protein